MDSEPTLPDLTPDDRVWRIDWLGETIYPANVHRYAQPSIKVALSPLLCDQKDHSALLSPDSTDHHHVHEAWSPVAALPLLATGDLWQNGCSIASPDYQTERFKGVRIHPSTTSFVKSGLSFDGRFLIPLHNHPWHRHHTQSYCVAVTLRNVLRLLVPCTELIRFYFGSSGKLVQRLFTAPLTEERLWTTKQFDTKTRHLHLGLASRLSGVSAADIGRIATSRFAWRAAAGIYTSCQRATAQRESAYPYTGFPFEGRTDLVASGLWLPFGEHKLATFLVYRLRSCSHPFPFHSLSYEASDRKAWHGGKRIDDSGPSRYSTHMSKKKKRTTNTDPGENKVPRTRRFKVDRRFPDLVRKQIWREKLDAMPVADVFLRRDDGSLEQVAFGEAEGHSDTASLDATQKAAHNEQPIPRFVREALKTIKATPELAPSGSTVSLVAPTGKSELVFSLPLIIDESGEIAEELLYLAPDGKTRQRRACFIEAATRDGAVTRMLVVEGKQLSGNPGIVTIDKGDITAAAYLLCTKSTAQVLQL